MRCGLLINWREKKKSYSRSNYGAKGDREHSSTLDPDPTTAKKSSVNSKAEPLTPADTSEATNTPSASVQVKWLG